MHNVSQEKAGDTSFGNLRRKLFASVSLVLIPLVHHWRLRLNLQGHYPSDLQWQCPLDLQKKVLLKSSSHHALLSPTAVYRQLAGAPALSTGPEASKLSNPLQ